MFNLRAMYGGEFVHPKPLSHAVSDYLLTYDLRGLSVGAKTEANLTLKKLQKFTGDLLTSQISQKTLDKFVIHRSDSGCSKWTVNKDISNLKSFLHWGRQKDNLLFQDGLVLQRLKCPMIEVRAFRDEEIKTLLESAPSIIWKARILLYLSVGERVESMERIRTDSFDLSRNTVDIPPAAKTGKTFPSKPLPQDLLPFLQFYLSTIKLQGNSRIFPDKNLRRTWDKIRNAAGLPQATMQDFRVTYGTWTAIAQFGPTQVGLSHSSVRTSKVHYIDRFLVLKAAVDRFPVKQWLRYAGFKFDDERQVC